MSKRLGHTVVVRLLRLKTLQWKCVFHYKDILLKFLYSQNAMKEIKINKEQLFKDDMIVCVKSILRRDTAEGDEGLFFILNMLILI